MNQVTRLLQESTMVAHFAAQFSLSHAAHVVTMTDEPALILEAGETATRYHRCAVAAARLLLFDDCAQLRDGRPRSFRPCAGRKDASSC